MAADGGGIQPPGSGWLAFIVVSAAGAIAAVFKLVGPWLLGVMERRDLAKAQRQSKFDEQLAAEKARLVSELKVANDYIIGGYTASLAEAKEQIRQLNVKVDQLHNDVADEREKNARCEESNKRLLERDEERQKELETYRMQSSIDAQQRDGLLRRIEGLVHMFSKYVTEGLPDGGA